MWANERDRFADLGRLEEMIDYLDQTVIEVSVRIAEIDVCALEQRIEPSVQVAQFIQIGVRRQLDGDVRDLDHLELLGLRRGDASSDETAFRLERAPPGGTFVTVGTTGANVTGFTDDTVQPETEYDYRLVAENAFGDSASAGPVRWSSA